MLTATLKSDAQIRTDVMSELCWEPRVDQMTVGVQVQGGIVVLTGTVKSFAEKIAAQNAAHRVSGVLDVANDIEVHPTGCWKKCDADLASGVRSALEWHAFVPDKSIHSTVTNVCVTLGGKV